MYLVNIYMKFQLCSSENHNFQLKILVPTYNNIVEQF